MASMAMVILSLALATVSALDTSDSSELQLAADPKASNAVKMVLKMMQDLDAKIVAEQEEETNTFRRYTTWCDDTKEEKREDIENGEDRKDLNEKNIKTAEGIRDEQTTLSEELTKDIHDLQDAMAAADAKRAEQAANYSKTNSDLEAAVKAARKAADAIRDSADRQSFMQMDDQVKAVRESALLAETLGISSQESLDALSNDDDPEQSESRYISDDWKKPLLEMLANLGENFAADDQKSDMEENQAITAYKLLRQERKVSTTKKKGQLDDAKAEIAAQKKKIATTQEDLKNTIATLADDNKFLDETVQTCLEKKVTFEQRKASRSEEREALGLAIKTMQDVTSGNFTEGNVSLLEVATRAATDPTILGSAEAEAEAIEDETGVLSAPLAFFQDVMRKRGFMRVQTQRHNLRSQQASMQTASHKPSLTKQQQALLQFLNEKATSTKSSKLVLLARRVATGEDPFGAVKKMIENMINKLRAEAEKSQTKKLTCDKKIGESTIRRDNAAKKVKEINSDMAESTARKDQLITDLAEISAHLKKMASEKDETTELREEEREQSEKTISEAKTGLSGVRQAMQIIKDFYAKSKENTVAKVNATKNKANATENTTSDEENTTSLLSVKPAPDAGFKNYESEQGAQAASTGIVGMLETIESDFKRTISDTQAEELQAVKAYKKFLNEMEISVAAKTQAQTIKNGQLDSVKKDLSDADTALATEIKALQVAIEELTAHEAECGAGVTFEERKKARKAEMEALEDAIEFFKSA